jgi:hypothetical protein
MTKIKIILLLFVISSCVTLKDPSFIEILNNSQHDINVDSVKYFTGGLPFIKPVLSESTRDSMSIEDLKKIDSVSTIHDSFALKQKRIEEIHKKYGLYKVNLGCMIDNQSSLLLKKYREKTKLYLKKRNGEGWEEKMEKEVNDIIN